LEEGANISEVAAVRLRVTPPSSLRLNACSPPTPYKYAYLTNASPRDRVAFLAGNTVEIIREKRVRIEERLNAIAFSSMRDFVTFRRGKPYLDLSEVQKLPLDLQREALAVIRTIRYTKFGPEIELWSSPEAITQLRRLNGLDAPAATTKLELSGVDGTPLVPVINLLGKPDDAEAI
jgi:hypothetical protein